MIYTIKRFTWPFICLLLVLLHLDVHAQVSLVQKAIDKLAGYKNFSYQSVYKQKEYTSDTLEIHHRDVFSKAPEDKVFGYLFSMEQTIRGNKFPFTTIYNGQSLININPADSTYDIREIKAAAIQGSLPDYLKMIEALLKRRPSELVGDTIINTINCAHLVINGSDTVINKEHYYTRIHLYIDKLSGMPERVIAHARSSGIGDGVTNYYSETRYFDYKFDQDHIDLASMKIPEGFHLPKEGPTLLAPGGIAPGWVLYAADGRKMSSAQMKGKVMLLDFFFIGCAPCMLSLKPLNRLHEKYKNQNVAMVSLTERDSRKSVLGFQRNYRIKYPMYVDAKEVVQSYHVAAFPTFYFIGKDGKIAQVIEGYEEGFEEKATAIINDLLKK
ncbi:peroxiredoxin [Chitinophaga sp. W3I9]|uniref:TlpA family protein disulfide reductase n=1 Tax=Chitinophaga sp. W3I9 TaxID=3373924 RepID=UPI003D22CF78